MRHLGGLLCVCALGLMPLVGCETADDGGTGGTAGGGGSAGDGGTGGIDPCGGVMCEDDGNACTSDACDPVDGLCDYAPVEDGTACGDDAGTCQDGSCKVACTEQGIRDAIAAGGGPYTFNCDEPQTVVLAEPIIINNNVTLDAEGKLTLDASQSCFGVWTIEFATAELQGFTVTKAGEAGCRMPSVAVLNFGTLALTNVTVSKNPIPAIANVGLLTLTSTTVSENDDTGIFNAVPGTLALTNSTVSGNSMGIVNDGFATLTNSTVSGNTDVGIHGETTILTNSLVDGDCGDGITSLGHNIESPGNTCGFDESGDQGDQFNVTEEDLNLGPLADNGGPTLTHKPGDGGFDDGRSVAIDYIFLDDCEVDEDQRGEPRPTDGSKKCDVGSVEVNFCKTFTNQEPACYPACEEALKNGGEPQACRNDLDLVANCLEDNDCSTDTCEAEWQAWASDCLGGP